MILTQYSYLSHEFGALFVDQEAIIKEFKTFESYKIFNERYPDNYEKERLQRDGSVNLEVYAYNFDTGNKLQLNLRYNNWDGEINENARCRIQDQRLYQNLGVAQFASGEALAMPLPFGFYQDGKNVEISGGVPESLKSAIAKHNGKMLLDCAVPKFTGIGSETDTVVRNNGVAKMVKNNPNLIYKKAEFGGPTPLYI